MKVMNVFLQTYARCLQFPDGIGFSAKCASVLK